MHQDSHNNISDGFELLLKKSELPLNEYTAITRCQHEIEAYLAPHIDTFTTVLPGAFARKTMVAPVAGSVVDMFILFKHKHVDDYFPSDLLRKLRVILADRYADCVVSHKHNALLVAVEDFHFRIQPGFLTHKDSYLVPSAIYDDWIESDTQRYREQLLKADRSHANKLLPVIRMIKVWNRLSGDIFDGYYLELLVKDVLADYRIKGYTGAITSVFKKALSEVAFKKIDPANGRVQVEGLLDIDDLIRAMLHIKDSYDTAICAVDAEYEGDQDAALLEWNKIFPHYFPTHMDIVIGRIRSSGVHGAEALKMLADTVQQ
jgi:hypothetical protein